MSSIRDQFEAHGTSSGRWKSYKSLIEEYSLTMDEFLNILEFGSEPSYEWQEAEIISSKINESPEPLYYGGGNDKTIIIHQGF